MLKDMVNLTDDISIHAPVKGATTARGTGIKTQHDFNPRSREGSDFLPKGSRNNVLNISIHAPVKGATQDNGANMTVYEFQSTLP